MCEVVDLSILLINKFSDFSAAWHDVLGNVPFVGKMSRDFSRIPIFRVLSPKATFNI